MIINKNPLVVVSADIFLLSMSFDNKKKTIWYRKSQQLHFECNAFFVRNFKIIMDFNVFKTSKLGVLKLDYIQISAYIAVLNFLMMF